VGCGMQVHLSVRLPQSPKEMQMRWSGSAVVILILLFSESLSAQGYTTSELGDRKHRDFAGKLCLETNGNSSALASNPKILNHSVILDNRCFEPIKAKVCYHGTDECTDVEVPPRSRDDLAEIRAVPRSQQFLLEGVASTSLTHTQFMPKKNH
jgi:hypothetical protein